ncbi:MAG: hypothetical protein V9E93_11155 [Steroidobacteraceae bacterium]
MQQLSGTDNVMLFAEWRNIYNHVGAKGRAAFGADRTWFVPYLVDVGAGDSKLTWQAMIGLGHTFQALDVKAVWRYLEYDFGNDSPIQSLNFNGPALGVTYRFWKGLSPTRVGCRPDRSNSRKRTSYGENRPTAEVQQAELVAANRPLKLV